MTNGVYDVYDVYDAFLTNPLTKSVRISIFSNLFLFFFISRTSFPVCWLRGFLRRSLISLRRRDS